MSGRRARTLLAFTFVCTLVAIVVRALRGGPAPAFSGEPATDLAAATLAPVADVAADEPAAPEPNPAVVAEAPPASTGDGPDAPGAVPPAWVPPGDDGACPEGYPVKAKLTSGIFHVPGMFAYDRTNPDRCYASAEAAEADGLRPAKR